MRNRCRLKIQNYSETLRFDGVVPRCVGMRSGASGSGRHIVAAGILPAAEPRHPARRILEEMAVRFLEKHARVDRRSASADASGEDPAAGFRLLAICGRATADCGPTGSRLSEGFFFRALAPFQQQSLSLL